jgi:hypothetical protein
VLAGSASLAEISDTLQELARNVASVAAAVERLEGRVEEISARLAALEPLTRLGGLLSASRPRRAPRSRSVAPIGRGTTDRLATPALAQALSAAMPAVPGSVQPRERSDEREHRWWVPRHRTGRQRGGDDVGAVDDQPGNAFVSDSAGESL